MPNRSATFFKIRERCRAALNFALRGGSAFFIFAALALSFFIPQVFPTLFKPVDYLLNDFRTNQVNKGTPVKSIVIVDIDERSLREQGAWPWSREKMAKLISSLLDEYGAASVVMDMTFPEQRVNEAAFMRQVARPQVVGGAVFAFKKHDDIHLTLPSNAPAFQFEKNQPVTRAVLSVINHPDIPFANVGHINRLTDADGSIRSVTPVICDLSKQARCLSTLSLAAYASQLQSPTFAMQAGQGWLAPYWTLDIYDKMDGVTPLKINSIPLGKSGELIVPYRHKRKDHWITNVSATDILDGHTNKLLLDGSMVFIGGTALSLADLVVTPFGTESPGFLPHIEILSALLDGEFSVQPRLGNWMVFLLLLPFALLCIWAQRNFQQPLQRFALLPAWAAFTFSVSIFFALWVFQKCHLLLPLLPIFLFPILALLLSFSYQLYRIGSDKINIVKLFSAYLPKQEASRLTQNSQIRSAIDADVDATRREITVLFADVNGFAKICEECSPEVIARLMHKVFTVMSAVVVQHNGTIDKFIGDAIMAFWNAPQDDPQHAQHALDAALAMQQEIAALDAFCVEHGIAPIGIGIGIETGVALVGNFGSEHRRTYTAMGEPVVLASRLEGITRTLQQSILIGERCAQTLGLDQLQSLGGTQVRGRTRPIHIYAPR
ncbi:CHASE2 domain-containing protein [Undibacterium sp. Di24W]|uniref:CHASE2 domain-containing protein n=1 Tax=Undibacterium sp. Di24W TaxID=3413033 RepID=UPI003BF3D9B4